MKLASYIKGTSQSFGIITEAGIVDLSKRTAYADLKTLISEGLDEAGKYQNDNSDFALGEVELLPVIPQPGAIWCAGMNTHSHYIEAKDAMGLSELPKVPMFFLRANNTLVASGKSIEKPKLEPAFDYEGEVALIIGKRCRNVSVETALDHVAGYTCFNDGSARKYQMMSNQVTTGKNGYRSGGFGPWMVTADSVDINALELTTRVNGALRQRMKIDDLVFSFAELISHISEVTWLEPGDVIVTGAAAGVGALMKPPCFLQDGDVVEVEVSGIGVLNNSVSEQVLANTSALT
ncbi:MAG: 2-keto-4-pentenoate hydratase/2-oxohepta-3-ene-1,7-dioic acid hydratase in catechol pathway [Candidatus Azotimanducaceae bacterium]|jgi:2-keto-4-pentenoate hydratase/2-oxohepta-3-ene-1,7-dioic acid hydratase in catechol pathway